MKKSKAFIASFAAMLMLAGPAFAQSQVKRGEYLASIMDCGGCHTPGMFLGKPDFSRALAGSEVGFQIPGLGIFYPANLTPDTDTGLGAWTEQEIITAVRTGTRPDGRILSPAMPWRSYAALNDADASALATYLKSIKPVSNKVTEITGASEKPKGPYFTIVQP
ncbi:c-type cytochrome [Flaviflagellibacter deserti]|jgi:mono/diheme cytochrome c family protein|uniref:C-type cytochrome n=1 Tax=Flaviflagellibacter deserti TaxID=2267266 RepID=A0ABV9Z1G1_9HYPH